MARDQETEAGRTVVGVRMTGMAVIAMGTGTARSDVVTIVVPALVRDGRGTDQAVEVEAREQAVRQEREHRQKRADAAERPILLPRPPVGHPCRPTDLPADYSANCRSDR